MPTLSTDLTNQDCCNYGGLNLSVVDIVFEYGMCRNKKDGIALCVFGIKYHEDYHDEELQAFRIHPTCGMEGFSHVIRINMKLFQTR